MGSYGDLRRAVQAQLQQKFRRPWRRSTMELVQGSGSNGVDLLGKLERDRREPLFWTNHPKYGQTSYQKNRGQTTSRYISASKIIILFASKYATQVLARLNHFKWL